MPTRISLLNKIPLGFVCHSFLQTVGSELLLTVGEYENSRQLWHFDILDPALCVAWRIFKLLLKVTQLFLEKSFSWQCFLLWKVYDFHHTMLVLSAFPAISKGLEPPSWSHPCWISPPCQKKTAYGPASHPQYYFAHHPLGCKQRSLFWNFRSHSNRVQFRALATLFHP